MKSGLVILLFFCAVILMAGCVQEKVTSPGNETPPFPEETSSFPITSPVSASPSPAPDESRGGPVQFVPRGSYHVGDHILITGTTILSPGNQLLLEVSSVSFRPTNKTTDNRFYGISAVITVKKGEGDSQNSWEYLLDTTDFAPDEYQVLISGITVQTYEKSASFFLFP